MHHEEQGEQKSLRCFSCRQRKVRCDRSYPTCGACARLSLSCSWVPQWRFKDQRKFIEERYDMTGSTPSRRTWERLEFVGNTCFPSPPSVSSADDNGSRSSPQSRDLQFQLPVSVDPAPSTRLQMLAVALQHYLPYDEQNYRCQSIEQWPTLNHLNFKNTSLVTATPLVNAAVDAFALAQVAISSMDPRLSLASIRRYNTCLQILRVTLEAETGYRKCDILLSMLVLQAVEYMRPIAQPGGYFMHIQGMVQFLAKEVPQRLSSCYETILFQHARQASILSSLALGRRTPFDTEEWISLSQSAPLVTSETRLLDIGVKIPNLLVPDHHNMGDSLHLSSLLAAQRSLGHWIEAYRNEKEVVLLQAFDPVLFPDFAQVVTHDLGGRQVLFCASFNDAWFLSLAWSLLFIVQSAHFYILVNSSEPALELECQQLKVSLQSTANALCSIIPQFFEKTWGFVARTSMTLSLQLLTYYYHSVRDDSMIEFCLKVRRALGRPELGHEIVTETEEMAFERYFSSLKIAETGRDASSTSHKNI